MRLSLGVHYRRCSSCLRVNRISGINVYRIVSCVFSHKNWHYFLGGLDTPSLKSCLARGETPFGGCTKKNWECRQVCWSTILAGCSSCATPVVYDGKPHNSLFQTRFGDEPCRAAQESHDFNRGRCQGVLLRKERDVPFALIAIFANVSCYFIWQPFSLSCISVI